jgi:RNA recognition motif. (a.k.a. RRM, RBD, or RNP domain)
MSNQSQTIIFTNLVFTNCGIPIGDDILAKLLARQCKKHGKIEYCNVIGSKNTGFVKFNNLDDAIFVKNLMNNQILFKSIVKIHFSSDKELKTQQRNRIGKMLEELL